MNFSTQLADLKKNNEDFEFYPTTNEIIQALKKDISLYNNDRSHKISSFLDIGAGNGKVIESVRELGGINQFYAIEKSLFLLQSHKKDVMTLGVDFHNTPLIDKEFGIIYCNPPYSEYEQWAARIIREVSNATIYLLIPQRWTNSQLVMGAIESREAEAEVVGSFDFLSSEDRAARAKVDLIRIVLRYKYSNNDPFESFFDENFKYPEPEEEKSEIEDILKTDLIKKENFVENLCQLYSLRMSELQKNYASICEMDYAFLKEFEITKESLMKSLKMKITTTKKLFWKKLFDEMSEITKRLTSGSRQKLLGRLNDRTGIEFNRENVYAVVIWAIKNSNSYFDEQLIEVYNKMIYKANIENYKSNQRVFNEREFRYDYVNKRDQHGSHFSLKVGHRIVIEAYDMGLKMNWDKTKVVGLSESAHSFIQDLLTIANNLGFEVGDTEVDDDIEDSKSRVYFFSKNGKNESIFDVRCFQNGNMHLRFNPYFIHALNIRHGQLRGWLRSKKEAKEEVGAPDNIIDNIFDSNPYINLESVNLLKLN